MGFVSSNELVCRQVAIAYLHLKSILVLLRFQESGCMLLYYLPLIFIKLRPYGAGWVWL